MLVPLTELLAGAEKGKYAVGAFNVPTLESVRAVVEAAEELRVPVILSHAEVHNELVSIDIIGPILVQFAERATVPVTVHLDHGTSLEMVKKAIDLGFTSVMIDASHMSYEDNVQTVLEVVEYAHERGVSVEAELGVMTSSGLGGEESHGETDLEPEFYYTDPEIAKDFVKRTDIDALAASFGTVHGLYATKPHLDFVRLQQIYKNICRPVVMHGGSGLSELEYLQAIQGGVRKINYYSYAAKAGAEAVRNYVNEHGTIFFHDLSTVAREAMKKDVMKAMEIFSRNNVQI